MNAPAPIRRGASALEFALAFPFILLLLVGSSDFALWSFTRQAVSRSVQDGAREASRFTLPANATDGTPITNLSTSTTRAALTSWGLNGVGATITSKWEQDVNNRWWLTVEASVPYTSFFGLQSPFSGPVTRRFILFTQEQTPPYSVP